MNQAKNDEKRARRTPVDSAHNCSLDATGRTQKLSQSCPGALTGLSGTLSSMQWPQFIGAILLGFLLGYGTLLLQTRLTAPRAPNALTPGTHSGVAGCDGLLVDPCAPDPKKGGQ
jgi:hypothetical protein